MRYYRKFRVVLNVLILILFFSSAKAQFPDIIIDLPDTLVSTGQNEGFLSVHISNFTYEVFGFQFVLVSSRPDLVKFAGFDSTGTLTSGFEYVEAIDRAGDQSELWFLCIADLLQDFEIRDGIMPNTSGVVVKIKYTTTNAPDTLIDLTSFISYELPTDFSDRYGNSLGMITETTIDTSYYICDAYVNDSCVSSHKTYTPELGYDFMVIDTLEPGFLDPSMVELNPGSITLRVLNCDQDGNGEWDISDLVCLIDYMFNSYNTETCPLLSCEVDLNQGLDISDLVGFIDYFFNDGDPPPQ